MGQNKPVIDDTNSATTTRPLAVVDYASPNARTPEIPKPIRPPGPLFGHFIFILFGMLLLIALVLVVMLFA